MTNQEAINHGKEQLKIFGGKHREFIKLAIKALEQIEIWNATTKDRQIIAPKGTFQKIWEDEQQPCEDCISRQAVLDNAYAYGNGLEPEGYCVNVEDIQALPPVTPQPTFYPPCNDCNTKMDEIRRAYDRCRWIPCSERMPEISDYYLIQYSRKICLDEMVVAYYSVEEAECDKNYTWEFKPFADCKEVIAWMPLPEPYKKGE